MYSEKAAEDLEIDVTLTMSRVDYEYLMLLLGAATGVALRDGDCRAFWLRMEFVNRINEGNARFTPYEIPEECRRKLGEPSR